MASANMGQPSDGEQSTAPQYFALWKMYLVYSLYVILSAWWAFRGGWHWLAGWLAVLPALHWAYVRGFPLLSRRSIEDEFPAAVAITEGTVSFYCALGCPVSRIIERRLRALQKRMRFTLRRVDVTLRPGQLAQFGSFRVPVVEVDGWNLVGCVTTAQLSAFISEGLRTQRRRRQALVQASKSRSAAG